ncbi:MAG: envelope stress response membrane protein PspB [Pseudomonadota bacterium]
MEDEFIIAVVAVVCLFVVLPGMLFHYITLWRKQKTLLPDDERMLEDMWRSAKNMERRIQTMEELLETVPEEEAAPRTRRRSSSERFED